MFTLTIIDQNMGINMLIMLKTKGILWDFHLHQMGPDW